MLEENKRKSLGRGLEALLGEMNDEVLNEELAEIKISNTININDIFISQFQPRKDFDETAIKSLSESIKEKGILQPLIVRKWGMISRSPQGALQGGCHP